MSNSIGSLRFLSAMDWREFVERMSTVERTLREDPAGVYGGMGFATRDRYRHVVEEIAKKSGVAENEAARLAIGLAGEGAAGTNGDDRAGHVGYYLIDGGLPQLEARVRVRSSIADMVQSIGRRFSLPVYLGDSIFSFALIFAAGVVAETASGGIRGPLLWIVGVLSLFSVSSLAIALVNLFATRLVMPARPLPRMDFSKGIPPESSTLVVVPTLLTSPRISVISLTPWKSASWQTGMTTSGLACLPTSGTPPRRSRPGTKHSCYWPDKG